MFSPELIESLKEIRKSARKMHKRYLEACGILSQINSIIPNDQFTPKEKIDIILEGTFQKCHCGEYAKANSRWCSLVCKNKDPDVRKNLSIKNTQNATERMALVKQTNSEKYGVSHVMQIDTVKAKTKLSKQKYYTDLRRDTFTQYGLNMDDFSDHEYLHSITDNLTYQEISNNYFNGMPPMTILRYFLDIDFSPNLRKTGSRMEQEISDLLTKANVAHERNTKKVISPLELDVYVDRGKFAIECNGLYWHSFKDKNYHLNKTVMCQSNGVDLLHIYEDEWEFKQNIVKSMILSKCGIAALFYARKCLVEKVDNKTALEFLDHNHLQGRINGQHYGLVYNGKLVSLATIGKSRFEKDQIELLRFSSLINSRVLGGFGKLLAAIKSDYKTPIITYADRRYSKGLLYHKFGEYIGESKPGYYWVDTSKFQRLNRMQTQKHKLEKLLPVYDSALTEDENMIRNGYLKIWDCGMLKFVL